MDISRRDFLRYCTISAAALGLTSTELGTLEKVLASTSGPSVIWLQGAACTGCSVSLLNRVSPTAPTSTADVLINSINLVYHSTIMGAAGEMAVAQAEAAYARGGYVLMIDGGVPTAFGGNTCIAWDYQGKRSTFRDVVVKYGAKAAAVVCADTCAAFGGIPASPPNPTGVRPVSQIIGKPTINIAGCPPHPDWLVWAIVQLLIGAKVTLDQYGRPTALYGGPVQCENCPRQERDWAHTYGEDNLCLRGIGCRGPATRAYCTRDRWNNKVNVCQESNAPCIGCVEPNFPVTGLYAPVDGTTGATTGGGDDDDDEHDDSSGGTNGTTGATTQTGGTTGGTTGGRTGGNEHEGEDD
jgi:hydrogenase small subunit